MMEHMIYNIITLIELYFSENLMNMYLIFIEGKYFSIDATYTSCQGYYIIIFSSSTYTLQEDLNIYGQLMSSDKIVSEGIYFSQ